jgi:aldehyde dehydrogenase (NAD+)
VSTPQQRFDVLDAAGAEILAHKNDVGDLLAREESKTLLESIGEVVRAANVFKFLAGEALRVGGDIVASVRPGVGIEVTREPGGVVGLITPWNFPIAIPAWKIALALAYGNAVVLKPADLVPGCAWAIADFLHRAGLPAGVFNLLMGRGSEVGQVLCGELHRLGRHRPTHRAGLRRAHGQLSLPLSTTASSPLASAARLPRA